MAAWEEPCFSVAFFLPFRRTDVYSELIIVDKPLGVDRGGVTFEMIRNEGKDAGVRAACCLACEEPTSTQLGCLGVRRCHSVLGASLTCVLSSPASPALTGDQHWVHTQGQDGDRTRWHHQVRADRLAGRARADDGPGMPSALAPMRATSAGDTHAFILAGA